MTIQPFTPAHWPAALAIYGAGIATGNATFTTAAPSWEDWDQSHLSHSRLVALDAEGRVLGWAALSPVSGRCVYGGVGEVSVYVAPEAKARAWAGSCWWP